MSDHETPEVTRLGSRKRVRGVDGWERIYDPSDRRKVVYYNLPGEPRFTITRRGGSWLLKRHTSDGEHSIVGTFPSLAAAKGEVF